MHTNANGSAGRLPSRLYAIVDVDALVLGGWEVLPFVERCLEGGARLLQLRAKSLGAGAYAGLARRVLDRAGTGALVIINDRVDVALVTGAPGVHVGQEDLDPHAARVQLGPEAVVGVSTHTPEQIAVALSTPASYVAVGPVYATQTKATGYGAVGVGLVAQARAAAGPGRPVVAIGGITIDRVPEVIAAGADAVAVIGGLIGGDPADRVRAYLDRLA